MKPEELRVVITKAIFPDPDLRYQTADEMVADINNIVWDKKPPVHSNSVADCVKFLVSGKYSKAKALAEEGNKNGELKLSCILAYILSTEGKAKEALGILEGLKATDNRIVLGLYGIIGCTYFGSSEKYQKYILKSADKGFCLAQYFIGRWYGDGQNGFKKDLKKGFDYAHASAKQGFLPATRYIRKALKRHKLPNSEAMIDLLGAELKNYDHDRDFTRFCIESIAVG
jgi:TPR repeat protein